MSTSITQIELPIPLQHPCPAQKRAKRKPRTAEGNVPSPRRRGAGTGRTAKVSLGIFLKAG